MYQDHFASRWSAYKPRIRARWPRLTPREVETVDGIFDGLSWPLQLRYGLSKSAADLEIRAWMEATDRSDNQAIPKPAAIGAASDQPVMRSAAGKSAHKRGRGSTSAAAASRG